MKTIQEVLKELDKEEVIDCYFSTYPINIIKDLDQEWDDMTVAECKTYSRDKIKALIDRVINTKGNLSADKKSILFAYKYAEDAVLEYDNYCLVMEMERVKAALLADTDELYSGR